MSELPTTEQVYEMYTDALGRAGIEARYEIGLTGFTKAMLGEVYAVDAMLNQDGGALVEVKKGGKIEIRRFSATEKIVRDDFGNIIHSYKHMIIGEWQERGVLFVKEMKVDNWHFKFGEGEITVIRHPIDFRDPLFRPIEIKIIQKEDSSWAIKQIIIDMDRISGEVTRSLADIDRIVYKVGELEYLYYFNGTGAKSIPVVLGMWFKIDRTETYTNPLPKPELLPGQRKETYPYVLFDIEGRSEGARKMVFDYTRFSQVPIGRDPIVFELPKVPDGFTLPNLEVSEVGIMDLNLDSTFLEVIDRIVASVTETLTF